MEITKVKYLNEVVQIDYQETSLRGRKTKKTIKSSEIPMQSFVDSLVALCDIYKDIIEKKNNVSVNGVSLKYKDSELTGGVIMGVIKFNNRKKQTVVNTPFLFIDHTDDNQKLPDGADKLFSNVIHQAKQYLDGNYAENDLFEDQEESDQDSEN